MPCAGSNLAGVLRDIVQAGRQQVIFHGHVQMAPVFIGQQGVQVSCGQGQRQKTTVLDQFCPKNSKQDFTYLAFLQHNILTPNKSLPQSEKNVIISAFNLH